MPEGKTTVSLRNMVTLYLVWTPTPTQDPQLQRRKRSRRRQSTGRVQILAVKTALIAREQAVTSDAESHIKIEVDLGVKTERDQEVVTGGGLEVVTEP